MEAGIESSIHQHSGEVRQVTRLSDVSSEGILLAGAGCAILLQLAHPAVGRGVARHSDFASDPMARLRSTLSYVYVVVCGDADEVAAARKRVRTRHRPVHGDNYDASDPALQLWVAATLYATAMDVYERVFGPLNRDDADSVYREYAVLGTTLDMPATLWPSDRDAFDEYWSAQCAALTVTDETRAVARELLHPRRGPWWLKSMMPTVRLVTSGLLPSDVCEAFQLPWDDRRQRRFDRTVRFASRVNRVLPARLRHWPRDHYLAVFRRTRPHQH